MPVFILIFLEKLHEFILPTKQNKTKQKGGKIGVNSNECENCSFPQVEKGTLLAITTHSVRTYIC